MVKRPGIRPKPRTPTQNVVRIPNRQPPRGYQRPIADAAIKPPIASRKCPETRFEPFHGWSQSRRTDPKASNCTAMARASEHAAPSSSGRRRSSRVRPAIRSKKFLSLRRSAVRDRSAMRATNCARLERREPSFKRYIIRNIHDLIGLARPIRPIDHRLRHRQACARALAAWRDFPQPLAPLRRVRASASDRVLML